MVLGNCGLLVYRRYICFYMDYCAAVFELYGEGNVGKEFIWMDSGSLDKFIVGNSLTVLLKAVVTEKQMHFSKIPLLHNYTAEGIMKRIDNFPFRGIRHFCIFERTVQCGTMCM